MSEGPPTSGPGADPGQQPAEPAQPEVPAGWYPHPTAPGWEAYWTGAGWGTDTRPAQAPAVPSGTQEQAVAQEPVAAEPVVAEDPVPAQEPVVAEPVAQEPVVAEPTPEPFAQETPAAEAQPVVEPPAVAVPASGQQHAVAAGGPPGAPPGAAATATTAAVPATSAATGARSDSSFPVILCVLGALVAIVGSFLPMASSSIDGIDFTDNTLFAQGLGIAVIALAVTGAALAVWSYLKANRTWLVVLLGAAIVAIAAYMGLVGVDDLTPDVTVPASFGKLDPGVASQLSEAAGQAANPDASPSTGIFAVGVGGLMMLLGGIGLARENR